jgi:tRNA G18 (ribose-2'-O)-methylase SpoU
VLEVSDPDDPRLDDFRNLVSPSTGERGDLRVDRRPIVIAEGANTVRRMAASSYRMRAVVGVPSRIEALRDHLGGLDVPAYVVDKWVLSDVVGFRVTRGVIATADRPAPREAGDLLDGARRVAVLESLNDFENVGALFRNAAAFGVDAVLLDPRCADPLYRRSVRVSMGHVLRVPFAVLPGPWPESLAVLRERGFRLLAMTPGPGSEPLRSVAASLGSAATAAASRWAVLLGAEGPGLTPQALAAADQWVRIPMAEGVDSLNVATAAAVAFAQLP